VPPTGPNAAHVDGKLVSAKGWPGLAAFMRECLRVLGTEVTHGEVKSVVAEKAKTQRAARVRVNNGATVEA
jgi:protease I